MTSKRIGFVGGSINSAAGRAHYCATSIDRHWTLQCGVFSRDREANLASGSEYMLAAEHIYASVEELLEAEKDILVAICILTPTPDHFSTVNKCLDYGIPVICEKALCCEVEEAAYLNERVLRERHFLAVIYNYSGYPMVREMKEMISQGKIGRVLHFDAEMPQETYLRRQANGDYYDVQEWRKRDSSISMISLDLGIHLHHLTSFVLADPVTRVVASQSSKSDLGVVDNVSALVELASKAHGHFWFSKIAIGKRNGLKIRVFGEGGSIEWIQENPDCLVYSKSNGEVCLIDRGSILLEAGSARYNRFKAGHPTGFVEALANLYVDISTELDTYKQQQDIFTTGFVFGTEHSLDGLRLMRAFDESARNSCWVDVYSSISRG